MKTNTSKLTKIHNNYYLSETNKKQQPSSADKAHIEPPVSGKAKGDGRANPENINNQTQKIDTSVVNPVKVPLKQAIINQFPKYTEQIKKLFLENYEQYVVEQLRTNSDRPQRGLDKQGVPPFTKVHEKMQQLVGNEAYLSFIKDYMKKPVNNQKFKDETARMEKEVYNKDAMEEQQLAEQGVVLPATKNLKNQFSYSSLEMDITNEFKNATWVVLTTPCINKPTAQASKSALISSKALTGIVPSLLTANTPKNNLTRQNNNSNNFENLIGNNSNLSTFQQQQAQLLKLQNAPPQKRYGHSACLVKNKMYVFGGLASHQKGGNLQTFYQCSIKFDMDDNTLFQWDKIKSEGPRARDSHTMVNIGESLVMFGGSGGERSFNDLYKYNLSKKKQRWFKLEAYGDIPNPREGHTAKIIGKDRMLVHGGVDQNETSFADTYILCGINQAADLQFQQPYTSTVTDVKTQSPMLGASFSFGGASTSMSAFENPLTANSCDTNSTTYASTQKNTVQQQQQQQQNNQQIQNKLRWHKCIDKGPVPPGRDSHSSVFINNKIYIFGGQGDGDMIFDDLYCMEVVEKEAADGDVKFYAEWELIEKQTPKGQKPTTIKPCARTSHTCDVYKNRFLIITGGETEISLAEAKQIQEQAKEKKKSVKKQKSDIDLASLQMVNTMSAAHQEISIDIDMDNSVDKDGEFKSNDGDGVHGKNSLMTKKPLNDVWVYDTVLRKWNEIKPALKIQGSLAGKKIKREFEPRMAHSSVIYDQYLILFGGLNSMQHQLISNDIYVLSLNGELGNIATPFEQSEQKQLINIPEIVIQEKVPGQDGGKQTVSKTLKITNQQDRQIMNGHVINSIINFSTNETNQYFVNTINNHQPDNYKKNIQTSETQVQTIDNLQTNSINQEINQNQLIQTILSKNDFQMRNLQRTKVSFLKTLAADIEWPLLCIGGLVDNSIQAFEQYKQITASLQAQMLQNGSKSNQINTVLAIDKQLQSLTIEINLNKVITQQSNEDQIGSSQNSQSFGADKIVKSPYVLEIKDNGPGISPKALVDALTSFSNNKPLQFKGDYNQSEHGIGLKLNSLRLGQTILIISKTKAVTEYGCSLQYLSFGLISLDFLKDSNSQYLVAPVISFELKNNQIYKELTQTPGHFLNMIAHYCSQRFKSGSDLQMYGMNVLKDQGTHIIVMDLKTFKPYLKAKDCLPELVQSTSNGVPDITINNSHSCAQECVNSQLEKSLRAYLQYLYLEYPSYIKISINNSQIDLKNPYSMLKEKKPDAFDGIKTQQYGVQILKNHTKSPDQKQSAVKATPATSKNTANNGDSQILLELGLEGMLIYRGNRLVRRLEGQFGSENSAHAQLDRVMLKKRANEQLAAQYEERTIFKHNGIISLFKSKSNTSLDKKDINEKNLIKNIKQELKEYYQKNNNTQTPRRN